jgi:hypothetical protein
MSAFDPKQTWAAAPHMSAFGGKADITILRDACLLLRSLLGVKQTCPAALHMSAFDPKRTFPFKMTSLVATFDGELRALSNDLGADRLARFDGNYCGSNLVF